MIIGNILPYLQLLNDVGFSRKIHPAFGMKLPFVQRKERYSSIAFSVIYIQCFHYSSCFLSISQEFAGQPKFHSLHLSCCSGEVTKYISINLIYNFAQVFDFGKPQSNSAQKDETNAWILPNIYTTEKCSRFIVVNQRSNNTCRLNVGI